MSLTLKTMLFDSTWGANHNMDFQYPQGLCFLEKYDDGSDTAAFVQNSGVLKTRMDQMGDHMKMNFNDI